MPKAKAVTDNQTCVRTLRENLMVKKREKLACACLLAYSSLAGHPRACC